MAPASAEELLAHVRRELEAEERPNRFVDLVAAGRMPRERLAALACEELLIVPSDQRSFAILAARFPDAPSGGFFLGLAQGEGTALTHLGAFAAALGLGPRDMAKSQFHDRSEAEVIVAAYEPLAGCQAYPAYVTWLAVNGSRVQMATALGANLDAFGSYCARIAAGLREHYGFDDAAVGFFDFFAVSPPGFRELMLSVIQSGLDAGEHAEGGPTAPTALTAARLLQSYELLFWDTLAQGAG